MELTDGDDDDGVAIDEEINSLVKIFEADLKRMTGIMVTYEEKKPDLTQKEKGDRLEIVKLLRESLKLMKFEFED